MERWFHDLTESMVRARLHGWQLWERFCRAENITPAVMQSLPNPAVQMVEFIHFMEDSNTPAYRRRDAMPAVTLLFSLLQPYFNFSANAFLTSAIRNTTASVTQHSRYRDIWDLATLLDFIRSETPADQLTWDALMARTAALFMVFVPLRPASMLRLDPATERSTPGAKSIEVQGHDKTDTKKGVTWVAIRQLEESCLCPLTHYRLLKAGAIRRGHQHTLWCTDAGTAFKRTDKILKMLKDLIHAAGVPDRFTGYSIRHATITALYRAKMSEVNVNAYTGHSCNAHTTLNYYYHLDKAWVGSSLAALTAQGVKQPELLEEALQDEVAREEEEEEDGLVEEVGSSLAALTMQATEQPELLEQAVQNEVAWEEKEKENGQVEEEEREGSETGKEKSDRDRKDGK